VASQYAGWPGILPLGKARFKPSIAIPQKTISTARFLAILTGT
jgi:hypothetical protein